LGIESGWKKELDHEIDQGLTEMVSIRRHLHICPEVSGEETRTTQYLKDLLADKGLAVRVAPDGCGLVAEVGMERLEIPESWDEAGLSLGSV
jgi:metal-dependent amidase/aminoacylase/carboxypeptidase family protein